MLRQMRGSYKLSAPTLLLGRVRAHATLVDQDGRQALFVGASEAEALDLTLRAFAVRPAPEVDGVAVVCPEDDPFIRSFAHLCRLGFFVLDAAGLTKKVPCPTRKHLDLMGGGSCKRVVRPVKSRGN